MVAIVLWVIYCSIAQKICIIVVVNQKPIECAYCQ